eukprot:scaffold32631_cov36-Tisochrysis_lutea.AAC.2
MQTRYTHTARGSVGGEQRRADGVAAATAATPNWAHVSSRAQRRGSSVARRRLLHEVHAALLAYQSTSSSASEREPAQPREPIR